MKLDFDSEEEEIAVNNAIRMEESFIRLNKADFSLPIFRVFSIKYLLELFQSKKNTLVKPYNWDDPFENFLFKQKSIDKGRGIWDFENMREKFYAQCWTLNEEETDALWRIYSPNKDGVRVRTTIGKLHETFYDYNYFDASSHFYIGKIAYQSEEQIIKFFENKENLKEWLGPEKNWMGHIESLLIKRKEFAHENEVRLIHYASPENYDLSNPTFKYEVNPNELFDELLFDPRFITRYFEKDEEILRTLGFTGNIQQSKLYRIPDFNIR